MATIDPDHLDLLVDTDTLALRDIAIRMWFALRAVVVAYDVDGDTLRSGDLQACRMALGFANATEARAALGPEED